MLNSCRWFLMEIWNGLIFCGLEITVFLKLMTSCVESCILPQIWLSHVTVEAIDVGSSQNRTFSGVSSHCSTFYWTYLTSHFLFSVYITKTSPILTSKRNSVIYWLKQSESMHDNFFTQTFVSPFKVWRIKNFLSFCFVSNGL